MPDTTRPRPEPPPGGYLTGLPLAVTTIADRLQAASRHHHVAGPPAHLLPLAEQLTRIAADLLDLLTPYTHRCRLTRATNPTTNPPDWTICAPDHHAGTIHLTNTTADTDGCLPHLTAAHAAHLGIIEDPAIAQATAALHSSDPDAERARARYRALLDHLHQLVHHTASQTTSPPATDPSQPQQAAAWAIIFGEKRWPQFAVAPFHDRQLATAITAECADLWPAGTVIPLYEPRPGTGGLFSPTDLPEPDNGNGRAGNPPGRAKQGTTSPRPNPPTTPTPRHHTPDTAGDEPPPATHPRSPARPGQPDR